MQISQDFARERSEDEADLFDIETLFEVQRSEYPYLNELWQHNRDLVKTE